jgi:hypothetical protein
MEGRAPRTNKWTAREDKQHEGVVLLVDGLVEIYASQEPRLAEPDTVARPPGTLVIDLTLEDDDSSGNDVLAWKPVHFHKDVQANQYADVTIRWDGKPIASAQLPDAGAKKVAKKEVTRKKVAKKKVAKKKVAKKKVAKKNVAKKKVAKKKVAKKKAAKKTAAKKRVAKKRATSAKRAAASRKKRSPAKAKKRRTARR